MGGTFANPSLIPDLTRVGARGVAAAALAAVAPPLALIPLIQLGGAKDVQCGPLLQLTLQQIILPVSTPPGLAAAKR